MSGWHPSRPPWETQDQPAYTPDDAWYGRPQGARVTIKPHSQSSRGRYGEPQREVSRGAALAGVVVGLAAAVGITAGAVQLTYITWGEAPAPSASLAAALPAPSPTPSASATADGATGTAYGLGVPATAGGYTRTSPVSPAIKSAVTASGTELMNAVEAAGGKPAGGQQGSTVLGEYFIGGDQALGYTGYTGTFTPAAVISAFDAAAKNVTAESAGPHGGEMACGELTAATGSGTAASGTADACVWATTTTIGMVEFFGGGVPENVMVAKAGADTLSFRDSVETATGAASPSASATGTATPTSTGTAGPTATATPTA
jgi:hypothetical protein